MARLKTIEQVLAEFKSVHGDKYDYSKAIYVNANAKVEIICPIHGSFYQTPKNHYTHKQQCPKCSLDEQIKRNTKDKSTVINDFINVHGNKYDYSKANYINSSTKVEIICSKHGSFYQTPSIHLRGCGCPMCKNENTGNRCRLTQDDIINKFKKTHGNKYDYSKVNYKNGDSHVTIICPVHGEFSQIVANHMKGHGCYKCAGLEINTKDVIEHFIDIHGDKYDYSKVNYVNSKQNIEIICPNHGSFYQTPNNHKNGQCCPLCSKINCKAEESIFNFVKHYFPDSIRGIRSVIKPYEVDIYIQSKRVAIEYNGLYWHSDIYKDKNYHKDKTDAAYKNNVKLLQIFEDEWLTKPKIVLSRIKSSLGIIKNKIYARKCIVSEIPNDICNKFLEKYHIQGKCKASIKLGLFYKNRLVAVMTFGKARFNKNYDYELLRYCSIANFNITGGASKLLSHFRKNYKGSIISYADKRWSDGNLYRQLGFKELKDSTPNYFYIKGLTRFSRNKFQKHKLKNELSIYDDLKTEYENMKANGYSRIYDCGNKVFVLSVN